MWRQMTEFDVNKVHEISLAQWGTYYYKSKEIFLDKLTYFPEGCLVYEQNNRIKGYLIYYPWNDKKIPKLNKIINKTRNIKINCCFICDIVLVPELRGFKIGLEIIKKILDEQKNVCMVAPVTTQYYWKRHFGFEKTGIKCDYGLHLIRSGEPRFPLKPPPY